MKKQTPAAAAAEARGKEALAEIKKLLGFDPSKRYSLPSLRDVVCINSATIVHLRGKTALMLSAQVSQCYLNLGRGPLTPTMVEHQWCLCTPTGWTLVNQPRKWEALVDRTTGKTTWHGTLVVVAGGEHPHWRRGGRPAEPNAWHEWADAKLVKLAAGDQWKALQVTQRRQPEGRLVTKRTVYTK